MKKLLIIAIAAFACVQTTQARFQLSLPVDTAKTDTLVTDTLMADSATISKKKGAARKEKEEVSKESEYEKLIKKGGTTTEGLFTVRHIEEKYYFEVPDSMLGRLLLMVTRFTAVPQGFGKFAGEEITNSTVYFEQRDEKTLFLRQYLLSYLADDKDNIARTLEKATIDPVVLSFKVIGKNEKKDAQLVEVTSLFKGDSHLTSFPSAMKTQLKVGGLQSDRTFIDTMKVYPTNIEILTTRTYSSQAGASAASKTGSMTMGFNTSIVTLPKDPMRKRIWDSRVGYFVNTFRVFSDEQTKADHESFVSRYRLVPKDKKKYLAGKLTEPEKQIVYYIDPATPKKWIPYLIAGVNDWNVAFEAAGFKNAIVAKEWPEDDPTMSLDDARFSVIRYLPSETENAYGPRIVDPRSGEIIEAHVCWFHNVMNLLTKWYMVQCGPLDKRAQKMKFDDRLMGQLIRFVSSHEVGHTLGLRHNMGASFATPVEKLRDKQWVEKHGHTASIMDYARFNYVAQPEDKIGDRGLFPRINDYDKWAIKWGYQWRPDFRDEFAEKEGLMKETTEMLRSNKRLWFGGEGQSDDPRAQTEDLGDNSVKASEYGIKNLKRVMENLPAWTHEENDQYEDLSMMYRAVHDQFARYLGHVMRNLGGHYRNNMPGATPLEPVPAERQKEVVAFIGRHIFDLPEWLYPASITSKTGTDVMGEIDSRQDALLSRLMSASLLYQLQNTAVTDPQAYQTDDYLRDVFAAVWKPLTGHKMKDMARRQLERSYMQNLRTLLNTDKAELKTATAQRSYSSDALLYVVQQLSDVENFCKQQLAVQSPNSIDALHYEELLRELKLIRERRTTAK